jgi:hypothetical protein
MPGPITRRARRAALAAVALVPTSYAWLALPKPTPGWGLMAAAAAELGAIALGIVALVEGVRARRQESHSSAALWAILGVIALAVVIAGNLIGIVLQ